MNSVFKFIIEIFAGDVVQIVRGHAKAALVETVQLLLRAMGEYGGNIDGDAGEHTRAALMSAKSKLGLPEDTEWNDETAEKIAAAARQRTAEFTAQLSLANSQ